MSSNGVGDLSRLVDTLTSLDLSALTVAHLQDLSTVLAPALGRLSGLQGAVVGELESRAGGKVPLPAQDGTPGPAVLLQHWLRDLTNSGGPAAGAAVRLARLMRSLPLVQQAVRDGDVQPAQAAVLTRLVGSIDAAALAQAEPSLVEVAAERDPQALAVYVSHLLATWCEPQFEADCRSQEAKRYLQTTREPDGMLSGRFRLTGADSEAFLSLLEPLARSTGLADGRCAGQRRADALVEVFQLGLTSADLPTAGGMRPYISYVVPAGWAAGEAPRGSFAELVGASLCEAVGTTPPVEGRCATGAWSGPQTRARIEALLCDARLTRVLLDPTGQVHSLEALGDSITKAQRRALGARDQGCAARGCTRPPAFCDAHHLDHRADGGATDMHNLVLLCRRHHVLWHQGRLQLRQLHVPWITVRATGPPVPAAVP